MSGRLSNLSLIFLGMDNVSLAISNASYVNIRKCVDIYKTSDEEKENISNYNPVNIKEANKMMQKGKNETSIMQTKIPDSIKKIAISIKNGLFNYK